MQNMDAKYGASMGEENNKDTANRAKRLEHVFFFMVFDTSEKVIKNAGIFLNGYHYSDKN